MLQCVLSLQRIFILFSSNLECFAIDIRIIYYITIHNTFEYDLHLTMMHHFLSLVELEHLRLGNERGIT